MLILTYLHDPDDLYINLIKTLKLPKEVSTGIISVSKSTTTKVKDLVSNLPFEIIEGGLYGESRIKLLKHVVDKIEREKDKGIEMDNCDESLKGNIHNTDLVLLCDFDKLIHWINTDEKEFINVINSEYKADFTVIGRSTRALSTYPDTWIQTEHIATQIMAKILKKKVDFMNGPLIINRAAVKIIADTAQELKVGSCAEFCLIANKAKLTIDSIEVDGLTWEDPDRYTALIQKAKSYDDWKYDTYYSLYEWRKRVEFLNMQVETMIRLEHEPINPKYPAVSNKTIE